MICCNLLQPEDDKELRMIAESYEGSAIDITPYLWSVGKSVACSQ